MTPTPRRRAVTVLELLIMAAVLGIIMAGLWRLFGTGVGASKRVLGALDAQQDARASLQRLVRDLQSARRLYFPAVGGKTETGVGFIDRSGRSILVFETEVDGTKVLIEADMNAKTRREIARDIESFRVTLPAPQPGAAARRVNITFGLKARGTEDDEGEKRPVMLATSVTLRALEERHPD